MTVAVQSPPASDTVQLIRNIENAESIDQLKQATIDLALVLVHLRAQFQDAHTAR